jgi:hypothetical protein
MQPTLHHIQLADDSVATVPGFNIKSLLLSFLNEPLHMKKEHFTMTYSQDKQHLLSLILTRCIWVVCANSRTIDIVEMTLMNFQISLIGFHDKTNTDMHGSLLCALFIVTPSFLNIECRNGNAN